MLEFDSPYFSRNLGLMSAEEQSDLNGSVIAVAGAGGDGGALAVCLARMGVGEIRLADPDPFETENINRQATATVDTVGENKAEAVGSYISRINPGIKVSIFNEGVTEDNVETFVEGADLVIDETEFTLHAIGVMLAREARRKNIPNLMALNIGFGALVTSYHPKGKTLEKMLGLDEKAPISEIAKQEVKLTKWLAALPSYADFDVFNRVAKDEISVPTVAPGVQMAAGAAATQALLHLTGSRNNRPKPIFAPHSLSIDAMTCEAKVIKHPQLNIYKDLIRVVARTKLGLNPKTVQ